MTDTADLVNCGKCRLPIHPSETGVRHFGFYVAHSEERCVSLLQAALTAKEAALAEAKRERDEARGIMPSKVWNEIFEAPANFLTGHGKHYYANHQIVREAHQRAKEQCPLAADVIMAQAFFQAVASEREEIAWKQVLDERARAEAAESSLAAAKERVKELEAKLNTPELHDFGSAVILEAAHQRERWGDNHDAEKGPLDWYWLIGYLAQKAVHSLQAGDTEKGRHHLITTAAACNNWHAQVSALKTALAGKVE